MKKKKTKAAAERILTETMVSEQTSSPARVSRRCRHTPITLLLSIQPTAPPALSQRDQGDTLELTPLASSMQKSTINVGKLEGISSGGIKKSNKGGGDKKANDDT